MKIPSNIACMHGSPQNISTKYPNLSTYSGGELFSPMPFASMDFVVFVQLSVNFPDHEHFCRTYMYTRPVREKGDLQPAIQEIRPSAVSFSTWCPFGALVVPGHIVAVDESCSKGSCPWWCRVGIVMRLRAPEDVLFGWIYRMEPGLLLLRFRSWRSWAKNWFWHPPNTSNRHLQKYRAFMWLLLLR